MHDRIRPGRGHHLTDRHGIQPVHHGPIRAQLLHQAHRARARRRYVPNTRLTIAFVVRGIDSHTSGQTVPAVCDLGTGWAMRRGSAPQSRCRQPAHRASGATHAKSSAASCAEGQCGRHGDQATPSRRSIIGHSSDTLVTTRDQRCSWPKRAKPPFGRCLGRVRSVAVMTHSRVLWRFGAFGLRLPAGCRDQQQRDLTGCPAGPWPGSRSSGPGERRGKPLCPSRPQL